MPGMCWRLRASVPYSSRVGPNIITPMPPMGLRAPIFAISSARTRALGRDRPPPP